MNLRYFDSKGEENARRTSTSFSTGGGPASSRAGTTACQVVSESGFMVASYHFSTFFCREPSLSPEQAIPEQDPKKRLVILTTLRDMTTRESSPEKKEKIRTLFLKALGGIGDRSQPVELGEFAEEYGRLLGRRQPLASSLEELTRKIVDLFVRYPERTALTILEGFVETLPESEVSESGKAVMTQWINILSSTKTPKEKLGALLELNEALNQLGDADGRLVYRTLRNAFSEGTNTLLSEFG